MRFDGRLLNDISIEDLQTLIDEKVSEGPTLDYKREAYSGKDSDKREMLRDITAFANTNGGYLILGMDEDGNGRASKFTPVNELRQTAKAIQQTCLDGIDERIEGLEVQTYETGPDQGLIVIRVPRSDWLPHMVKLSGRTDFLRRYSDEKRNMTVAEIRRAFLSVPAYHQIIEGELQALSAKPQPAPAEEYGPPYAQAITDKPVARFINQYMLGRTDTQVLVIVSPFISDLDGFAYDLRTILKRVSVDKTRLYVITRPPTEKYQHDSMKILEACPFAEIRYNSDIHAKLYINWSREERENYALFGSGNLTRGGTQNNIELGMMIFARSEGRKIIRQLYNWSTVDLRTNSQLFKSVQLKPGGN